MAHFAKISAACLAVLAFSTQMTQAEVIGTVGSVTPQMAADGRALTVGAQIAQNQTLRTTGQGRGQLIFLDQSTLSVAPNSTLMLDQFVYDPNKGSGAFGVALTKGALRFVGGKTAHDNDATITTPAATIGVRGSSVLVDVQDGRTIAVFIAGERLCMESGGARHCTNRQGGVLAPEGYLGKVSADYLAYLLERIDGSPRTPERRDTQSTGLPDQAPFHRGTQSTRGEESDPDAPDQAFHDRTLIGLLPGMAGGDDDDPGGIGGPFTGTPGSIALCTDPGDAYWDEAPYYDPPQSSGNPADVQLCIDFYDSF